MFPMCKRICILLSVAALVCMAGCTNRDWDKIPGPDASAEEEKDTADEGRVYPVEEGHSYSEKDIAALFTAKGFEAPTSVYSMDGHEITAIRADAACDNKHPLYDTRYVTANGELWGIYCIDDYVFAHSMTYNMSGRREGPAIVYAESDEFVEFNRKPNTFYRYQPDSSEIEIRPVDDLTAQFLESVADCAPEDIR